MQHNEGNLTEYLTGFHQYVVNSVSLNRKSREGGGRMTHKFYSKIIQKL